MAPFQCDAETAALFAPGDILLVKGLRLAVEEGRQEVTALLIQGDVCREITLRLPLAEDEREILLAGCLINYYAKRGC